MHMERTRVGQFFLFIGLILLVIFFTTDHSLNKGAEYLFIGLLSSVLGFALILRNRKPHQESRRFRILRKRQSKAEREMSKEQ